MFAQQSSCPVEILEPADVCIRKSRSEQLVLRGPMVVGPRRVRRCCLNEAPERTDHITRGRRPGREELLTEHQHEPGIAYEDLRDPCRPDPPRGLPNHRKYEPVVRPEQVVDFSRISDEKAVRPR